VILSALWATPCKILSYQQYNQGTAFQFPVYHQVVLIAKKGNYIQPEHSKYADGRFPEHIQLFFPQSVFLHHGNAVK